MTLPPAAPAAGPGVSAGAGAPDGRAVPMLRADLGPGVLAGFTTRAGGVSAGSYAGLNLALHVGDAEDAVTANRALLAQAAGAPVWFAAQVHGTGVLTAEGAPPAGDGGEADVVVAAGRGTAAGVLVADCVPVLLADAVAGVVAAVHAGRRGFAAGVLEAALTAMTARGARPERIGAAIGPAAGGCCYEVPAALRDEVAAVHPAAAATTTWGTPSLDLRAGCRAALEATGVGRVVLAGGCTIEDESLYSYRREARTGRFAGVVRALP